MKATEQYFHVKGSQVDETLVCNHSNESYRAVLSSGSVKYSLQGGSNVLNPSVRSFTWKLIICNTAWPCLLQVSVMFQTSCSTTDARSSPCSASCMKFSPRIVSTTFWAMANILSGRNAWITNNWCTAWPLFAAKERGICLRFNTFTFNFHGRKRIRVYFKKLWYESLFVINKRCECFDKDLPKLALVSPTV